MQRWTAALLRGLARRGVVAARRRLLAAGERGDQNAVDELWSLWLMRPADAEVLEPLRRWRRPSSDWARMNHSHVVLGLPTDESWVAWLARRQDHPVDDFAREYLATIAGADAVAEFCRELVRADPAEVAAAIAFCVARGIAPDDPVQRAGFLVLTGQRQRYREHDPDGGLLAEYHQRERHPEGPRVRARLVDWDEADRLLRLLELSSRIGGLHAEEFTDGADGLVRLRAWPQLWTLLSGETVDRLMGYLDAFPADWRPADRALFEQLVALPGARPKPIEDIRLALDGAFEPWMGPARFPLRDLGPDALDTVEEALADPGLSGVARDWLEPLAVCLRYRFAGPPDRG